VNVASAYIFSAYRSMQLAKRARICAMPPCVCEYVQCVYMCNADALKTVAPHLAPGGKSPVHIASA